MTVEILRVCSNAVRFLMSKPLVAETVVDIATTNGIATPNAWGQAVTITGRIDVNDDLAGPPACLRCTDLQG